MIFLEESKLVVENQHGFNSIMEFAAFKFEDVYGHRDFTKRMLATTCLLTQQQTY